MKRTPTNFYGAAEIVRRSLARFCPTSGGISRRTDKGFAFAEGKTADRILAYVWGC